MRNINEKYLEEVFDDKGYLTHAETHVPADFNFSYDIIDDIATHDPQRVAAVWCNPEGEEHIFTFADIKKWSDKTANLLASQGIGKGDPVLVMLRRHYQFWFVAPALNKLGALLVPATFMLKEHDLEYRLNAAGIKSVICTTVGTIADVVENVVDKCPTVKSRFLVNGGGGGLSLTDEEGNFIGELSSGTKVGKVLSGEQGLCTLPAKREGWIDFNSGVLEASEEFAKIETLAKDPMLMYFTSGTSGNPKMVLHDSGYAIAHTITAKHWHNVVSDNNGLHFTIADTGWGKAVWGKFYGQWIMEAACLIYDYDRFNGDDMLGLIEKYQVTTFCCPPTMYRLLVTGGNIDKYDLSSLVFCTTAGEALNPDLFDSWKAHTSLKLTEGFGQTETPLTVCNLACGPDPKPGSMGMPSPLYTVEIQTGDGKRCNPGQTGEVCIKMNEDGSHPDGIMVEYYLNPEKTAEAIYDGWYHTGDTAWVDEDGYFWYVGRNDDVIKSSGYRIGPFEIESVLLEHDAVAEAAVTGIPDPIRGKAVKATIVLAPGFVGDDNLTHELQTWVKRKTAPYKYPRVIDYIDELPKTVNGKVRRVAIRNADEDSAE